MQERPPADHRVRRVAPLVAMLAAVAAVAAASFAGGFWTSRLADGDRVRSMAEARFREFLSTGIDLGFVTVDTRKLDEIRCIAAEAAWEDREAEEHGDGETR